MEEKSNAKALLMFPLKALANDQLNKMRRFTECAQEMVFEINTAAATAKSTKEKNDFLNEHYPGIDMKRLQRLADAKMAVCDGDTADDVKAEIRKQGTQVILTNPDSLHHAMLPGHKSWGKKFWGHIKYVVLDEAHTHTGVAGSHVANVLRRLLRVCTLGIRVRESSLFVRRRRFQIPSRTSGASRRARQCASMNLAHRVAKRQWYCGNHPPQKDPLDKETHRRRGLTDYL